MGKVRQSTAMSKGGKHSSKLIPGLTLKCNLGRTSKRSVGRPSKRTCGRPSRYSHGQISKLGPCPLSKSSSGSTSIIEEPLEVEETTLWAKKQLRGLIDEKKFKKTVARLGKDNNKIIEALNYSFKNGKSENLALADAITQICTDLGAKFREACMGKDAQRLLWPHAPGQSAELEEEHNLLDSCRFGKWNCAKTELVSEQKTKWIAKCSLKRPDDGIIPPSNKFFEIVPISDVANNPRSMYWTATTKNRMKEDSKYLANLPYFEESDEEDFVTSLLDTYGNKLHNEDYVKCKNEVFFELIHTIMCALENQATTISKPEIDFASSSKVISTEYYPSYNVFNVIGKGLPDFGSPVTIAERYVKSCKAMFPLPMEPVSVSESKVCRISLENYFCDRCEIYTCAEHDANDRIPVTERFKNRVIEKGKPDDAINYTPTKCLNTDCVRVQGQGIAADQENNFTENEKVLFRSLFMNFPNQYCSIAQLMGTKTCKEVLNYSLIGELTEINEKDCRPRPVRKKKHIGEKQSKQTTWLRHYTTFFEKSDGQGQKKFVKEHGPRYMPCYHLGEICSEKNNCRCYESGSACDKYCGCSPDCPGRFPGCACKGKCTTKSCPCVSARRECDPTLCGGCQQGTASEKSCRNDSILRGLRKKLEIKASPVDGHGAFMLEPLSKGDYIIEYCGEKISHDEADRRGALYDKKQHTFLFDLNEYFVLDATVIGSNARFINSSKKPNCEPRQMLVNGDHRLGIYALRDIMVGEELFINYNKVLKQHNDRRLVYKKKKAKKK